VATDTGQLTFLNRQPTHGADPYHVTLDAAGRHAFVANFMSGSVCVLPVGADGRLGKACDFVQHVGAGIDPARQQGPHAHSLALDAAGQFAFVPDLGLDRVMIYRFDTRRGMLDVHAPPWIKMRPGAGPRHLAFHPSGRFAYLVNELDSTIVALAYDAERASFAYLQSVPTLPAGFTGVSSCADIHVAPGGRFVYASNRGHDSIATFAIDPSYGLLTPRGHTPTQGRTPRSFGIDASGSFLLAANQDSDTVVLFRVDAEDGSLRPTATRLDVPTPVCITFA
jgi:6-phosphogluconolactonase